MQSGDPELPAPPPQQPEQFVEPLPVPPLRPPQNLVMVEENLMSTNGDATDANAATTAALGCSSAGSAPSPRMATIPATNSAAILESHAAAAAAAASAGAADPNVDLSKEKEEQPPCPSSEQQQEEAPAEAAASAPHSPPTDPLAATSPPPSSAAIGASSTTTETAEQPQESPLPPQSSPPAAASAEEATAPAATAESPEQPVVEQQAASPPAVVVQQEETAPRQEEASPAAARSDQQQQQQQSQERSPAEPQQQEQQQQQPQLSAATLKEDLAKLAIPQYAVPLAMLRLPSDKPAPDPGDPEDPPQYVTSLRQLLAVEPSFWESAIPNKKHRDVIRAYLHMIKKKGSSAEARKESKRRKHAAVSSVMQSLDSLDHLVDKKLGLTRMVNGNPSATTMVSAAATAGINKKLFRGGSSSNNNNDSSYGDRQSETSNDDSNNNIKAASRVKHRIEQVVEELDAAKAKLERAMHNLPHKEQGADAIRKKKVGEYNRPWRQPQQQQRPSSAAAAAKNRKRDGTTAEQQEVQEGGKPVPRGGFVLRPKELVPRFGPFSKAGASLLVERSHQDHLPGKDVTDKSKPQFVVRRNSLNDHRDAGIFIASSSAYATTSDEQQQQQRTPSVSRPGSASIQQQSRQEQQPAADADTTTTGGLPSSEPSNNDASAAATAAAAPDAPVQPERQQQQQQQQQRAAAAATASGGQPPRPYAKLGVFKADFEHAERAPIISTSSLGNAPVPGSPRVRRDPVKPTPAGAASSGRVSPHKYREQVSVAADPNVEVLIDMIQDREEQLRKLRAHVASVNPFYRVFPVNDPNASAQPLHGYTPPPPPTQRPASALSYSNGSNSSSLARRGAHHRYYQQQQQQPLHHHGGGMSAAAAMATPIPAPSSARAAAGAGYSAVKSATAAGLFRSPSPAFWGCTTEVDETLARDAGFVLRGHAPEKALFTSSTAPFSQQQQQQQYQGEGQEPEATAPVQEPLSEEAATDLLQKISDGEPGATGGTAPPVAA